MGEASGGRRYFQIRWMFGVVQVHTQRSFALCLSCGLGTSAHVMCELAAWPSPVSSYTSSLLSTESTIGVSGVAVIAADDLLRQRL